MNKQEIGEILICGLIKNKEPECPPLQLDLLQPSALTLTPTD